ncbi:MAG: FtsW/RodA/SpoVE family cell cycle protein [Rhodospirillales bacterium]
MATFSRADTSIIGRWWWTVDRLTLFSIVTLIFFGYVTGAGREPRGRRAHSPVARHFYPQAGGFPRTLRRVVVGVSLLSPRSVRRLALVGCLIALGLTALTLVHGIEIKGARRWIHLPGMQIQPSEFLKPCFAVVTAWLLTDAKRNSIFPGTAAAFVVSH